MEASSGERTGRLLLLLNRCFPTWMDGFYPVGNWSGKSLLLFSLTAGQRQEEQAPSGSWCPAEKSFLRGETACCISKKKENPWKLRLKLGFAVTSSGSQAGSCGKGLRSLAGSDGMYFVPGFAQITHQENQSPPVHAQSQPWVFR